MEDYVVIGRIGEGAHGVVMKGRHKQSGRVVALKKVLLKRLEDGIPATALREIKALQVCWYKCIREFVRFDKRYLKPRESIIIFIGRAPNWTDIDLSS